MVSSVFNSVFSLLASRNQQYITYKAVSQQWRHTTTCAHPVIIIIIIELTHGKTILEITVEIEPQPAALDFKSLSQYSSCSSKTVFWTCAVPTAMPICFNLLPNCLGIAPKEPTTNGMIFTFHTHSISSVTPFPTLDTFLSYLSPCPQSYYLQELQNQLSYNFSPSYQLQPNLVSELL